VSWRSARELLGMDPDWSAHPCVPYCVDSCPSHDGKRCVKIGHRPPSLCEPMVQRMGELLDAAEELGANCSNGHAAYHSGCTPCRKRATRE